MILMEFLIDSCMVYFFDYINSSQFMCHGTHQPRISGMVAQHLQYKCISAPVTQ